jgi:dTDP-4-dehydrorhamnose reductase
MEKILITGSTGMLGRYVCQLAMEVGLNIFTPKRDQFDISNSSLMECYIDNLQPTAILHLAAETNVDLCERDPRHAGLYNHIATETIAKKARQHDAWMLYISTSNVFGAEGKPYYNELDIPNSVNYYGRSKFRGENAVQTWRGRNSMVIRAGWMIGGGVEHDHKFVGKIVQQMRDGVSDIRSVTDKYGTITNALKLARFIVKSLEERRLGTYHYSSSGLVNRFEIAREIAAALSFNGTVSAVISAEFPLSAPRPSFEGIESVYLPNESSEWTPRYWREDLREYLREFTDRA